MQLDVALVDHRQGEGAVYDDVGFCKPLLRVAYLVAEVARHVGVSGRLAEVVALQVRQQDGRVRGHRLVHVVDHAKRLVLDLDAVGGFLSRVAVYGRDGRYDVALVEDLVVRHDVQGVAPDVDHPLAGIDLLVVRQRQVGVGHGGVYAGHGVGGRGVDALDARVRVRASKNFAPYQPGELHVAAVHRSTGDLVVSVVPDGSCSHHLQVVPGFVRCDH